MFIQSQRLEGMLDAIGQICIEKAVFLGGVVDSQFGQN